MPDFVYIPVPAQWATVIYKQLAELEQQGHSTLASDPEPAPTAVELDAALVERMYRESRPGHRRLMEFLANHPDEWFYTSELAHALNSEKAARGVAGMLGAFGKRSNHRYSGHKPWETEWDEAREEARHRMGSDHAQVINTIAAALDDSR